MKLIVLLAFVSFISFSLIYYKRSPNLKENNLRLKRSIDNEPPFDFESRRVLPRKRLRRLTSGKNYRKFVVDREDVESLRNFFSRSGAIISQLTLKNFNTVERTKDIWHHRLMRAAHLETRKTIFDFSKSTKTARLTFDNCHDGWFPFDHFEVNGPIEREEIQVTNPTFDCEFHNKILPKTLDLVDKFGSFAVKIDHSCKWRYWNFDVKNVNVDSFDFQGRTDLNFTSSLKVVSMAVKGFGSNAAFLNEWLIQRFRLDWIKDVGVNDLVYKNGCLVFEDTSLLGVFHLKGLRQLHYDKENIQKSAPFVIHAPITDCINFPRKLELFQKFGNVALHIMDPCPPESRKVLIVDGRHPFDYVMNRDDIKFQPGDSLLFVRIRYFTEEDHLKNLDRWFKDMGYHNVEEIGDPDQSPSIPEVTVSGSISTFMPVPFAKRAIRNYTDRSISRYTVPLIYFRNNSGLDCQKRRSVDLFHRSVGKFSVSTSHDCECGQMTTSDFFWRNCLTHRGTIEITGSPSKQELLRYQNIREIRDGQLWIRDTDTLSVLKTFSNLEKVHCESKQENMTWKQLSAVRVDGRNRVLENVDLSKLKITDKCNRLVTVSGDEKRLPKYSESQWMEKNRKYNSISIQSEGKTCVAYSGKGGGLSTEFAHQLEGCRVIEGNLNIDGEVDDIQRMTSALRNIVKIRRNVNIRNLKSENCNLLTNVKYIGGNLTFDNNPFLRSISFALLSVNGTVRITRSRQFCSEFQETRSFTSAFRLKNIVTDCPFYDNSTFSYFEGRVGDISSMSHLGICFTFAFFTLYMMPEVLWNQLKPLNVSRWREMTELDMRLKLDREAYLDEESSDEEPDVITWKRKLMIRNRLDGRDIEGERIRKERKDYRENRRGVKLSQKIGALVKTMKRKDSDSEYSGQSWLRRKQKRKLREEGVKEVEDLPLQLMLSSGQTKWVGKPKPLGTEEEEKIQRKLTFYDELTDLIEEVAIDEHKEHKHRMYAALDMLEEHDLLCKTKFVTNYDKIEKFISYLETHLDKNDAKKWNKLAALRRKVRLAALEKFGDGEKIRFEELANDSDNSAKANRMEAGVSEEEKERSNGMFAKVIVETLHWKPPKLDIAT